MILTTITTTTSMHQPQYCHNNNSCHMAAQQEAQLMPMNANSNTYYDEREGGYSADLETDPLNSPGVATDNRKAMIWRILLILQVLAVVAFTCFALYAVVAGNTDAVLVACPKLWQYVVARIMCGILVGALLLLGHYYLFGMQQQQYQWASMSHSCSPWNMMIIFWALMFCYFCSFFVVGMTFIPNILSGSAGQLCSDTLTNTVATGTPLLAYIGWVTFVCDGIASALILVLVIYLFTMTPTFYFS